MPLSHFESASHLTTHFMHNTILTFVGAVILIGAAGLIGCLMLKFSDETYETGAYLLLGMVGLGTVVMFVMGALGSM